MKDFKTIAVVAHPLELVWATIRDRMPEMASLMDDIESITVMDRREEADGTVFLVNRWKANPKIPSMLNSFIDPSMLAWTDRAQWKPALHECIWNIETQFFSDGLKCAGSTRYEPAMGGRGTRITFAGDFNVIGDRIKGIPTFMEGTISKTIESFATSLIPKNFLKLSKAVGEFLDANG
jgi:hypothetical protein